jgi:hypothetical protein
MVACRTVALKATSHNPTSQYPLDLVWRLAIVRPFALIGPPIRERKDNQKGAPFGENGWNRRAPARSRQSLLQALAGFLFNDYELTRT